MQLTENDTTQDMPFNLPPGFFIPTDEEGIINAPRASNAAARSVRPGAAAPAPATTTGPKPGMLFDEVDAILRRQGVPTSTVDRVQEAMRRELDGISKEVAERVVEG